MSGYGWMLVILGLLVGLLLITAPLVHKNKVQEEPDKPLMSVADTQLLHEFRSIPREDRTEVFEAIVNDDADTEDSALVVRKVSQASLIRGEAMPSRYELEVLGQIHRNNDRVDELSRQADENRRSFDRWRETERNEWNRLLVHFDADMQNINRRRSILEFS